MKFVRCDKCGKTMQIGLVDSDYVILDDDGKVLGGSYYDNPNIIAEREICGKELDICGACYSALKEIKEKAEKEFLNSITPQKECGYGTKTND